jgi:hypothetical protein
MTPPPPPPQFPCPICGESLDLTVDFNTDEMGLAVHEQCYVERLLRKIPGEVPGQIKMPVLVSR